MPGAPTLDILSFGEPMIELSETDVAGRAMMQMGFGGDTSNVAVAAARQGASAGVLTSLGDDAFGDRICALWDREGVDHALVARARNGRTGVYFITYGRDGHEFSYAREGSAASRFAVTDLPADAIRAARVFHASGISQGIGAGPCDATFAAIEVAKQAGRLVSYDTNLRLKLWPLDRARAIIHATAKNVDILRPGFDDACALTGLNDPDRIADFYLRLGAKQVVLTLGARGCMVATQQRRETMAAVEVEFVDAAGAGDAFTGAFLAEYLKTNDPFASARYANVAAALQTRGRGAIEPIPYRRDVEAALRGEPGRKV